MLTDFFIAGLCESCKKVFSWKTKILQNYGWLTSDNVGRAPPTEQTSPPLPLKVPEDWGILENSGGNGAL